MTQKNPKDLADALAALAAGHHEEPEPGTDEHDQSVHLHQTPPQQPTAPKPPPVTQRPVPPANTARRIDTTPAKPPAAPLRKPEIKASDSSAGFADAVAHLSAEDPAEAQAAKDDSEVIVPAPTMDAFIPHYRTPGAKKTKDPLESRRTLIPILLTSGMILLVIAGTTFVMGRDSALSDIVPMWGAAVLLVAGAISLAMAAMNMIHVKNALARRGK